MINNNNELKVATEMAVGTRGERAVAGISASNARKRMLKTVE